MRHGHSPRPNIAGTEAVGPGVDPGAIAEALLAQPEAPLGDLLEGIEHLPGVPWELVPSLRSALELQGCATWSEIAVRSPSEITTLKYVTRVRAEELLSRIVELWRRRIAAEPTVMSAGSERPVWDVAAAATEDDDAEVTSETVWDIVGDLADQDASALATAPEMDVRATRGGAEATPDEAPTPAAAASRSRPPGATVSEALADAAFLVGRLRTVLGAERYDAVESLVHPDRGSMSERVLGPDPPRWLAEPGPSSWSALDRIFAGAPVGLLVDRMFANRERATLGEVGVALGVTRERVRQIEKTVRERFENVVNRGLELTPVALLAIRVRNELGPLTRQAVLDAAIDRAILDSGGRDAPESTVSVRRGVLRELVGDYREERGLLVSVRLLDELHGLREIAAESERGALLPGSLLTGSGLLEAVRLPDAEQALMALMRLRRVGDHLVRWDVGLADKAVAVLSAAGHPMTQFELHEAVGFDANPRSLLNAVADDARLMRRGKDRFGLREWGGEEYSGIRTEIEQAIERAGGSIPLDKLVESFVEQFGVTANSVRSYAADRQFIRRPDNTLEMRGPDDPDPSYRYERPEDTAGTTLIGGVWHARIRIDFDTLRGSGRPIRNGIALVAGLEPDLILGFHCDGHPVTIYWNRKQPNFGSLRSVAAHHGCAEGDLLFIPLSGPDERSALVVRRGELTSCVGLRALALSLGQKPDDHDPLPSIAVGLGLPPGADALDVADRLGTRGETDLLELLPTDR